MLVPLQLNIAIDRERSSSRRQSIEKSWEFESNQIVIRTIPFAIFLLITSSSDFVENTTINTTEGEGAFGAKILFVNEKTSKFEWK